eukprot:TRINITY_DN20231_c0_g1_i1.p1 TRINITY_DN20231_c0_g1~~TRINITY_DN20231_c0_g1_i1.p1  ORF type:complete len:921 (+),score=271.40 TRINITY_DN20231_c0_g1_i1:77-2764(+)
MASVTLLDDADEGDPFAVAAEAGGSPLTRRQSQHASAPERRGSVRDRARMLQQEAQQRKLEKHRHSERRRSMADDRLKRDEEATEGARRALSLLYWFCVLGFPDTAKHQLLRARAQRTVARRFLPIWRHHAHIKRQRLLAEEFGETPAQPTLGEWRLLSEIRALPEECILSLREHVVLVGIPAGETMVQAGALPPGAWLLVRGRIVHRDEPPADGHGPQWFGALCGGNYTPTSGSPVPTIAAEKSLCWFLSRMHFDLVVAAILPPQLRDQAREQLRAVAANRRLEWLQEGRMDPGALYRVQLLQGWPQPLLSALADQAEPIVCAAGDVLQKAGDIPACILVIAQGRADVLREWDSGGGASKVSLERELRAGDAFCEEEIVFQREQSRCTVRCSSEVDAWRVPRDTILAALKHDAALFLRAKQLGCELRAQRLGRPPLTMMRAKGTQLSAWPPRVVQRLRQEMEPLVCDSSQVIAGHREPAQGLYFISRGSVQEFDPEEPLGLGDVIGLWETLLSIPHAAEAKCQRLTELWFISAEELRRCLRAITDWTEDALEQMRRAAERWHQRFGEVTEPKLRSLAAFAEALGVPGYPAAGTPAVPTTGSRFDVHIKRSGISAQQLQQRMMSGMVEHHDQQTADIVDALKEHLSTAEPVERRRSKDHSRRRSSLGPDGLQVARRRSSGEDKRAVQDVLQYDHKVLTAALQDLSQSRKPSASGDEEHDGPWRKGRDKRGEVFWYNVDTLEQCSERPPEVRQRHAERRRSRQGGTADAQSAALRQALEEQKRAEAEKYSALPQVSPASTTLNPHAPQPRPPGVDPPQRHRPAPPGRSPSATQGQRGSVARNARASQSAVTPQPPGRRRGSVQGAGSATEPRRPGGLLTEDDGKLPQLSNSRVTRR